MQTESLKRWLVNVRGWKSDRRLLLIESDDWGMVRMASPGAYQRLRSKGYPVEECPYNRYDMLESGADLEALSETLAAVRDGSGRPAVLTANMIMGNPDFSQIREHEFGRYSAQPFWDTLDEYGHGDAIAVYRQARDARVVQPQLHGRDHVAVGRWLLALRNEDARFKDAFAESMFTVHGGGATNCRRDHLDTLGFAPNHEAFPSMLDGLSQAQSWFTAFWGMPSRSFIAPCYTWHGSIEPTLHSLGVRYLQGSRVQKVPDSRPGTNARRMRHFTGQRNALGQRYLVRNVTLEPSIAGDEEKCLERALVEVAAAFRQRTPAIVSSHRLNYIGGLDVANRDRGLRVLRRFLDAVLRRWPAVEFVSTDELGQLMET